MAHKRKLGKSIFGGRHGRCTLPYSLLFRDITTQVCKQNFPVGQYFDLPPQTAVKKKPAALYHSSVAYMIKFVP